MPQSRGSHVQKCNPCNTNLLTKITATLNEVALSYHTVRRKSFLAVIFELTLGVGALTLGVGVGVGVGVGASKKGTTQLFRLANLARIFINSTQITMHRN